MVVHYILCRCHAFVPLPLTVTEAWRSVIAEYSSASTIRLLRGFCCQYSGLAQRSASQFGSAATQFPADRPATSALWHFSDLPRCPLFRRYWSNSRHRQPCIGTTRFMSSRLAVAPIQRCRRRRKGG